MPRTKKKKDLNLDEIISISVSQTTVGLVALFGWTINKTFLILFKVMIESKNANANLKKNIKAS